MLNHKTLSIFIYKYYLPKNICCYCLFTAVHFFLLQLYTSYTVLRKNTIMVLSIKIISCIAKKEQCLIIISWHDNHFKLSAIAMIMLQYYYVIKRGNRIVTTNTLRNICVRSGCVMHLKPSSCCQSVSLFGCWLLSVLTCWLHQTVTFYKIPCNKSKFVQETTS